MDSFVARTSRTSGVCLLALTLIAVGLTFVGAGASSAAAQPIDADADANVEVGADADASVEVDADADAEPGHVEFGFDVVGGYVISQTAYPWVVSGYCGGTLIEPQWVISAAHCGDRTGSTYLIGGDETRTVAAFFGFTNPYDGDFADLALWKLDQPSTKTPLPRSKDTSLDAPGVDVQGFGYGDTEFGGGGADGQLRSTGWVTIDRDAPRDWAFEFGDSGGTTCFGDSGGPVVRDINPPNGDLLLVGIVSYTVRDDAGVTCTGRAGATKIANQAIWIDATINANGGPGSWPPGNGARPTPTPTPVPARPTPSPTPTPSSPPAIETSCVNERGQIAITLDNNTASFTTNTVTVGGVSRVVALPGGSTQTLRFDALRSGTYRVLIQIATTVIFDEGVVVDCAKPVVIDTFELDPVMHATSCLGSNGRHDVMAVNLVSAPAQYRVQFGNLAVREFSVEAGDWGRLATTGRPDGTYRVIVRRAGLVISDENITISCDTPTPTVGPETIQVINSCRDGYGYVIFQFVNPTPAASGYVIEFENVQNRSTSAAAFGATVRSVTGRPTGSYKARIRDGLQTVAAMTIDVNCS